MEELKSRKILEILKSNRIIEKKENHCSLNLTKYTVNSGDVKLLQDLGYHITVSDDCVGIHWYE